MGFLLKFFSRNSLFLFFIFLQIIALSLVFSRNIIQRSWLAGQATVLNSWVSGYIDEGASYLQLKQINEGLVAQNKQLMKELYGKQRGSSPTIHTIEDTIGKQNYTFIDGDVIFNSITQRDNYLTVNRGKKDGILANMGVIAPNGIVGIVINTTNEYSLIQSVLSVKNMKINGALKHSGYFGTLTWKGEDARIMHLANIPKYVPLKVGDTVITDGKSAIFPQGIMIGKVAGYEVDKKTGFWDISVELSEKMGAIGKVYIVKNLQKTELQKIEDTLQATIKRND